MRDILQTWLIYAAYTQQRRAETRVAMTDNINWRNGPLSRLTDAWAWRAIRGHFTGPGAKIREGLINDDMSSIVEGLNDLPYKIRPQVFTKIEAKIDDVFLCCSCAEAALQSQGTHSEYHDETYCESCSDQLVHSTVMDSYIRSDEASRYYKSTRAFREENPDYCIPDAPEISDAREYGGDYFDEDTYFSLGLGDDEDSYDDDSSDGNIGNYHSSKHKVRFMPDPANPKGLTIGLEIEVEVDRDEDRSDLAGEMLDLLNDEHSEYCAAERDGSLDNGFEVVTGWTTLAVHRRVLRPLQGMPFSGRMKSHDTETCGLHIHVEKRDMTPLHATKMVAFIHCEANKVLIKRIARRYRTSDGFAKFDYGKGKAVKAGIQALKLEKSSINSGHTKKKARAGGLQQINNDRYEALNFNNEKTVEFRLFKGSLRYETIVACAEFAQAVYKFCSDAGLTEMTDAAFCQWICRRENLVDTEFLRSFLKAKGHAPLLAVQGVKKEDKRVPVVQLNLELGPLVLEPEEPEEDDPSDPIEEFAAQEGITVPQAAVQYAHEQGLTPLEDTNRTSALRCVEHARCSPVGSPSVEAWLQRAEEFGGAETEIARFRAMLWTRTTDFVIAPETDRNHALWCLRTAVEHLFLNHASDYEYYLRRVTECGGAEVELAEHLEEIARRDALLQVEAEAEQREQQAAAYHLAEARDTVYGSHTHFNFYAAAVERTGRHDLEMAELRLVRTRFEQTLVLLSDSQWRIDPTLESTQRLMPERCVVPTTEQDVATLRSTLIDLTPERFIDGLLTVGWLTATNPPQPTLVGTLTPQPEPSLPVPLMSDSL